MKEKSQTKTDFSRREFIKGTGLAAAGFTILPSSVIAGLGHKAPSDKLNIAGIGIGGMGRNNLRAMQSENIVALCDVDWKYAQKTFDDYPDAKKYWDYRKMLREMDKDIDALVIATADHTHAIIAAEAMEMGKHVFVQKPLTLTVYESRLLTRLARKNKVITQMGNQGNSGEGIRQICEWIWDGQIGEITNVHTWTNRPIWPQGLERPKETPPVPDTLNWDLFLGPAPERPYNPIYTPWNFRGWWDFGTGALGDMACHIIDPVFKALKLNYPTHIQSSSTPVNSESPPVAQTVEYSFPERPALAKIKMPPVKIKWWDGGMLPPRPDNLPPGVEMGKDSNGGCWFEGTKGSIMCGSWAANPWILGMDGEPDVPKTLPRIELSHEMDFVRACKDGFDKCVSEDKLPSSNFDYSGPLNEMVVMGVAAVRLQNLKRVLEWDGENMKFTNISDSDTIRMVTSDDFEIIDGDPKFKTEYTDEINAKTFAENLINKPYRKGWKLPDMPK
ncbi:MAG: Gfo/Idh/MocA family oxidoreductase [Bacteroidetes bacterium]|jgi:predicted dehydrogenase|nr:Gfo/Idh/MocA family oxidoreductase [Bacteroidota bacterium]